MDQKKTIMERCREVLDSDVDVEKEPYKRLLDNVRRIGRLRVDVYGRIDELKAYIESLQRSMETANKREQRECRYHIETAEETICELEKEEKMLVDFLNSECDPLIDEETGKNVFNKDVWIEREMYRAMALYYYTECRQARSMDRREDL